MFKDYYAILEIGNNATSEEIKSAFKKQALKWHPDRNPGVDTTPNMQVINEAKLILLDMEARLKYDIEYKRYKFEKREKEQREKEESRKSEYQKSTEKDGHQYEEFEDFGYQIYDEELYKWMNNAKKQSVDLAKKTIEDFKGMVKSGTKAAVKEAINVFVIQIVLGVIISFFFLLSRACNN